MKHKFISGYFMIFGDIILLIISLLMLAMSIHSNNIITIILSSIYIMVVVHSITKLISGVYLNGRMDGLREGYQLHYKQMEQISL